MQKSSSSKEEKHTENLEKIRTFGRPPTAVCLTSLSCRCSQNPLVGVKQQIREEFDGAWQSRAFVGVEPSDEYEPAAYPRSPRGIFVILVLECILEALRDFRIGGRFTPEVQDPTTVEEHAA